MSNVIVKRQMLYKEKKEHLALEVVKRTLSSPSSIIGAVLFLLIIVLCVGAPLFTKYGVNDLDLTNMYSPPTREHLCGTDSLGRDIFARLLYGGRYSLAMGLCASVFSQFLGIVLGCIAGYFGAWTEKTILRILDIWSAIPGQLLCIIISTVLGPGVFNTILALSIGSVPHAVRMVRGQVLAEKSKEYLEAAESIDCSKFSIMFKHMLPNVIQPSIIGFTMGIGNTITAAAGLSYIGLGIQPPTPEWGAMLSDGKAFIEAYPHMIAFPGIIIGLTVLALNLVGDGLRDALDPKLRK